eukprot:m.440408 g.440408  ORF g.440408 m.440408 type:complete len:389 (+) comp18518_c0_seq1:1215-2381(+)
MEPIFTPDGGSATKSTREFDLMDAASVLGTWASSRETSRVNSPVTSRPASPSMASHPESNAADAASAMAAMEYVPQDGLPPVAYAKLAGDNFVYYVQSMMVTLGRGGGDGDGEPDVDLGREKSISRRHATIQYDSGAEAFFISPLGKNGLRVGRNFYKSGSGPIKLHNWSRIQIANVGFWFILPQGDVSQTQQPLNCATQLHLHPLISRAGSPTADTVPNSIVASRDVSPYHSDDDSNEEATGEDTGEKPPLTYAELIIDALAENGGRLSLKAIYTAICKKYLFYRRMKDEDGWKNSIRHNLSLNVAFKKTKRLPHEAVVKGNYWMYDPPTDYVPPKSSRSRKKNSQSTPKSSRLQAKASKSTKHRSVPATMKLMSAAAAMATATTAL